MTDQFDEFLEEVQQDIKHEKYLQLWKKYGRHVTTAAVSILAAATAYMLWQNHLQKKHMELSDAFLTAQMYIAQNKLPEAFAVFEAMRTSNHDVYGYLRHFEKSAALLAKGDAASVKEACDLLEKMAKDSGLPVYVKDYAAFLFAKISYEQKLKSSEETLELLKPLSDTKNPWRLFVEELKGLIYYTDGRYKDALEIFAALVKDENTPEGLRIRAQMMVQLSNQNVRFKP